MSTAALLRALLFVCLVAPSAAHALTALWYEREDGASGGGPTTYLYQTPTDTFTFPTLNNGYISVRVNFPNTGYAWLDLAPPQGGSFAVGAYEEAARAAFRGSAPGLELIVAGSSCADSGRFSVLELVYDSEFNIASFAANFEQHCSGQAAATYGEVRINSSVPLTMSKPAGSTLPDPFAFKARTGLNPSTSATSNSTTLYGINAPAPISITGGEYSINEGAFTSAPGTIANRDHVRVRATSPAGAGSSHTATLTVGGRSAPFVLTTYAPGQALTAFRLRSGDGDWAGGGETLDWRAPQLGVTVTRDNYGPGSAVFNLVYGSRNKTITLASALKQPLVSGAYEQAARTPFRGASPGLDFYGDGRGCNEVLGRFAVLEAEYAQDGTVERFAADFEQWCDGGQSPSFGEIRFNSTVPLTSLDAPGDSMPDPFALNAQSPVRAGALVRSNWITIYGVNAPVPISISGGEYSVNGGPFTNHAGTVKELDSIVVHLTASASPGGIAQATLTAGGRSATLSATTWQQGMSLTGLYYRSTSGDYIGQGETRIHLAPFNEIIPDRQWDNGVRVRLNGTEGSNLTLNLGAPGNATLAPGAYEGAQQWPASATAPGIMFFGNGRGCSSTGRFVIHEVAYALDGSVQNLAVDFEHRCDTNGAPLFGEVRFNSTVPFSAMTTSTDLALTQSAPPSGGTGKDVVFTLEARNNGLDSAPGATIASTVDPAAIVIWASPACTFQSGTTYSCALGAIAPGAAATVKLVLRKSAGASISNNAVVSLAGLDTNNANNASNLVVPLAASPAGVAIPRYRLYSPVTLEHHFTTDLNEYTVLGNTGGTWIQEGTVGKVLDNPGSFNGVETIPYYRLYDTSTRWHHWTTDSNEYYTLGQYQWWNMEGVDGYILPTQATDAIELYRLTYPAIPGLHHWTVDPVEYGELIGKFGWIGEPGAGFVIQ